MRVAAIFAFFDTVENGDDDQNNEDGRNRQEQKERRPHQVDGLDINDIVEFETQENHLQGKADSLEDAETEGH